MNIKKTLIVAVIAIVAVAALMMDQKKTKEQDARKEAESRLVAASQDQIGELTIRQENGKTTQLVRQDGEWRLAQPLKVRAGEQAVGDLLGQIDSAKRNNAFDPQGKLEDFGLKTPAVTLEVKAAKAGSVEQIELGAKTSAGDEVYARAAARDKEVFTLPVSLLTMLERPVNEIRDKRLVPIDVNQASSVTLAFDGKTIELQKREGAWRLARPLTGDADGDKAAELLREIAGVTAADFIDTAPLNMASMGLEAPALRADFNLGGDKATSATLLVGSAVPGHDDQVYAMQPGANYAFTILKTDVDKLKPALDDLRSKQIFATAMEDVGRVVFDVRGQRADLSVNSAGRWRLTDDASARLDNSAVTQKVGDLLALRAVRFLADDALTTDTGLDDPNLRLTVAAKDGQATQTLITGRTAESGEFVYARLVESGQTLGIDPSAPSQFFIMRDQLLDKALFNFDPSLAKAVRLNDGQTTATFTRTASGAWKAEGGAKLFDVEGTRMTAMLYSLGALEWDKRLDAAYPTDAKLIEEQKLAQPEREIVVLGEDGAELARLGQGGDKGDTTYVRRGAGEYFGVNKLKYATLKNALDEVLSAGGTAPAEAAK